MMIHFKAARATQRGIWPLQRSAGRSWRIGEKGRPVGSGRRQRTERSILLSHDFQEHTHPWHAWALDLDAVDISLKSICHSRNSFQDRPSVEHGVHERVPRGYGLQLPKSKKHQPNNIRHLHQLVYAQCGPSSNPCIPNHLIISENAFSFFFGSVDRLPGFVGYGTVTPDCLGAWHRGFWPC